MSTRESCSTQAVSRPDRITKSSAWAITEEGQRIYRGRTEFYPGGISCLTLTQRRCLLRLAHHLYNLGHHPLSDRISDYLDAGAEAYAKKDYASFTGMRLHRMAAEIAAAIRARLKLRLGSIQDPTERFVPYRAVSVWSGERGNAANLPLSDFAFMSAWPGDPGSPATQAFNSGLGM
ncbi:hypothetical protein DL765_004040 [Monosporascus sp. GIB2]|nr:hypothetical protein DL765_004040 [Monosporascus sp. GIB2]